MGESGVTSGYDLGKKRKNRQQTVYYKIFLYSFLNIYRVFARQQIQQSASEVSVAIQNNDQRGAQGLQNPDRKRRELWEF